MKNVWYEIPVMESLNPQKVVMTKQIENLCSRQTRRTVQEASSVRFGSSGVITIVHPE